MRNSETLRKKMPKKGLFLASKWRSLFSLSLDKREKKNEKKKRTREEKRSPGQQSGCSGSSQKARGQREVLSSNLSAITVLWGQRGQRGHFSGLDRASAMEPRAMEPRTMGACCAAGLTAAGCRLTAAGCHAAQPSCRRVVRSDAPHRYYRCG